MTPELEVALAEVDRVFAGHTCATDNVCLHCYPEVLAVELSRPDVPLDAEMLSSVTYESPGMVGDHDGLVRRILPQMARGMVDGTLSVFWAEQHALARGAWRTWDAREADVIRRFIDAWWLDLVFSAEPRHEVRVAFEAYVAITADLGRVLEAWPRDDVAGAHFVALSADWLRELVHGDDPLDGIHQVDEARVQLERWYVTAGAARLRDAGAEDLAADAELLALDIDERMRRLYGAHPAS